MDPVIWYQAQRALRQGRSDDHEIVYRFHSHPLGIAWPSMTDIGAATYPQREIIYSNSFNTFFCYAPEGYAGPTEFSRGPVVGENERAEVTVCELTEYTQTLTSDYGTNNKYEDFSDWSRRYR
jgi:hypothetical protein